MWKFTPVAPRVSAPSSTSPWAPQEHERAPPVLGEVPVGPDGSVAVAAGGEVAGVPLSDDGQPRLADLAVQPDAVVSRQGQRQRREEGADFLPVDQARRPPCVRLPGHEVALEAAPPGDRAQRLVPFRPRRRSRLPPLVHVVALDQEVAQGPVVVAPREPGELRQRVILETVVLIARARPVEEGGPGDVVGEPRKRFALYPQPGPDRQHEDQGRGPHPCHPWP